MEGDINGFIQSKSTGREPPGKVLPESSLVSTARSCWVYTRPRLGWFTLPYRMEVDQTQPCSPSTWEGEAGSPLREILLLWASRACSPQPQYLIRTTMTGRSPH